MYKVFLIFGFGLVAQQASAQLSTDYSVDELIARFVGLSTLTLGRLLSANDTIGPIEQEVKFYCYNRNRPNKKFIKTHVIDKKLPFKLDLTKPLHIITHGWLSSVHQNWAKAFRHDLVKFLDVNVCVVDWERLANFEYFLTASEHVPLVGDYIAEFVIQAYKFGIPLDDINLIGHSLGAQISGRAGLKVFQALGDKIGTIFGLDPANPLFCLPTVVDIDNRLDATDAKFVQIIHSSDGAFGCEIDQGHQDFKPDGGYIPQTACIVPVFGETVSSDPLGCSHYQSVLYYRYSVNPANVFTGTQCTSFVNFLSDRCNSVTDILGPYSQRISGRFYLSTSAFAPFTPISPTGRLINDNVNVI